MKETRIIMGMPVTVEIVPTAAIQAQASNLVETVFTYFNYVDEKFSTYKEQSEISLINRKLLSPSQYSRDMQIVFDLAEQTKQESDGYFDIASTDAMGNLFYDPSGLVKGWAIDNAAMILWQNGVENFYVEAGGDLQAMGTNSQGQKWQVGIRNPFQFDEIVKVLAVSNCGVATSGTYLQGQHIYNPKQRGQAITNIVSLTVVGPTIFDADRFATAAFAMGRAGIEFIESLEGFEGYMIDADRQATFTSSFARYISQ